MNRFALICLVFGPLASMAYPQTKAEDLSCQDFTLDKCTVELEGLIETVKDIDEEFCQKYCDIIYTGICKFFIYDRKQRICNLLSEPIENYVQTCRKIAGPKTPSSDECAGSLLDPCNAFVEGYCRFEGNLLEHLENIPSATQCQVSISSTYLLEAFMHANPKSVKFSQAFACLFVPSCNYFLYDVDLTDCELFDSEKRDCDLLRGPPKPDYNDCQSGATTTPQPTTTTTTESEETTFKEYEGTEYDY